MQRAKSHNQSHLARSCKPDRAIIAETARRNSQSCEKGYWGQQLWSRGYLCTTVGCGGRSDELKTRNGTKTNLEPGS